MAPKRSLFALRQIHAKKDRLGLTASAYKERKGRCATMRRPRVFKPAFLITAKLVTAKLIVAESNSR